MKPRKGRALRCWMWKEGGKLSNFHFSLSSRRPSPSNLYRLNSDGRHYGFVHIEVRELRPSRSRGNGKGRAKLWR